MPPRKPTSRRYDAQKRETFLRNLVNTTGSAAEKALAGSSYQGAAALLRLQAQARDELDKIRAASETAAPPTAEQVLERARERAPEIADPILEVFAAELCRRRRLRLVPEEGEP